MSKPGDMVRIYADKKRIEGTYTPRHNEKSLFLKLESGYNIGIDKKKITSIETIKKLKETILKKEGKVFVDKKMPTISILHTGGTIASKVDYRTGAVVSRFEPTELLEMFPELKKICNIKSELISQMFSEDIRFKHYALMAKAIEKQVKAGVDGVILTHGTDTMGYSAAALAFMLEDLPIPVILVGAQRSSDRGSSDAGINLICAAMFIAKTDFAGVAICMHKNMNDEDCLILPACKTRKMHSSRRDAFKAVNDSEIALVNYRMNSIRFSKKNYLKKDRKNKLKLRLIKDNLKIGILKMHPNMMPEEFSFYKKYDGLVMEGTGLGHAPVSVPNEICKIHAKNLKAIQNLAKKTIVVMTSQTVFGRVNMNVYSTGIDLQRAGVIPGEDMLTETAFIKLAWLLSNYKKGEIKAVVGKNFRGEITGRTLVKEDFLE